MKKMHVFGPKAWTALGAAAAALLLASGCASTGEALAPVQNREGDAVPAAVRWRTTSPYGEHGNLQVSLEDGPTFLGSYERVGQPRPLTEALWHPWRPGWPDWPLPWEGQALPSEVAISDEDAAVERYTGLVIANLQSPDGERMRCRFGLLDATLGLAGGFDGDCQLMGGAAELRASLEPGL